MKIRDNETGQVFEYGTNRHHALRISKDGSCLTYENLQNGDGSCGGGYSFVMEDGKTPEESDSQDAMYGATYANIGGFGNPDIEKILQEIDEIYIDIYGEEPDCNLTDAEPECKNCIECFRNRCKYIIKKHLSCENHSETTRQSRDTEKSEAEINLTKEEFEMLRFSESATFRCGNEFISLYMGYDEANREYKTKTDGWIPVKDGLPEENEEDYYDSVTVTLSDGTVRPGVYRNIEDEWYVENEEGVKTYRFSNEVIAWRPLPEPYKPPVESAEEKRMREREEFFRDGE